MMLGDFQACVTCITNRTAAARLEEQNRSLDRTVVRLSRNNIEVEEDRNKWMQEALEHRKTIGELEGKLAETTAHYERCEDRYSAAVDKRLLLDQKLDIANRLLDIANRELTKVQDERDHYLNMLRSEGYKV